MLSPRLKLEMDSLGGLDRWDTLPFSGADAYYRADCKPNSYDIGQGKVGGSVTFHCSARWLTDEDGPVYECRNCGPTLEATDKQCPTCGSIEIAVFDDS